MDAIKSIEGLSPTVAIFAILVVFLLAPMIRHEQRRADAARARLRAMYPTGWMLDYADHINVRLQRELQRDDRDLPTIRSLIKQGTTLVAEAEKSMFGFAVTDVDEYMRRFDEAASEYERAVGGS